MRYWPLSPTGSVLLGVSLYLLGSSVPRGRGYGIFLALLLLFYLALSLIRAGAAAFRFEKERFEWRAYWNYGPSLGKRKNMLLQSPEKARWGMRYHFILRGTLSAGENPLFSVRTGKVFTERLLFEQVLPLPGLFDCRGRLYLSDLFGFIRFPLTDREHRQVLYHPPLLVNKAFPSPKSADENEEKVQNDPANPEKVLMRDYQPGDLVRDINWKASGKFSTIYTRIAPDREQTVSRMTLVFRNEGTAEVGEPASSVLLFGLKSLGATMIHAMRKANPSLILEVHLNDRIYDSRSDDFEQNCLGALCRMGAKEASSRMDIPEGAFVCTTAADRQAGVLKKEFARKVMICSSRAGEQADWELELLLGNPLPRGEMLKAVLKPGTAAGKTEQALGTARAAGGDINTGVRL